jgi:hypothetical protein
MLSCSSVVLSSRVFNITTAFCLTFLSLPVLADQASSTISDPGFRPHSEYAPAFIEALPTASVEVYPTIVRRLERTALSFASQDRIVTLLKDEFMVMAVARNTRFDLGKMERIAQWDLFQNDMKAVAENLGDRSSDADYRLVLEIVMQPGNQVVFGIHCYVLDQQGQNVFSFLLNSHHQIFVDAKLFAEDSSEAARERLMQRATQTGIVALQAQIDQAKYCATHQEISPTKAHPGIFDDFESGLTTGADNYGVPLGYVTFSDDSSTVNISTTEQYPSLPPKIGKNNVLQLDMNVNGWAGFIHVFPFHTLDQWVPYDWSDFQSISFWLYGNNSGTSLFVDVLDNRNRCSTVDDAERFVYQFTDDFSGWEHVSIRFTDMVRKEIGNRAPNDGLGLTAVHGWAFGALSTDGPMTFYIDEFELRRTPKGKIHYPINELPMYGERVKTPAQIRADKAFIKTATKGGKSREDAAEYFAQTGWNSFYKGDQTTAIKRFNQAWLLDPSNQHALWGFAVIAGGRNQIEEAVRFFRIAIENGPENPSLQRDYKFALKQLKKSKS